MDDRFKALYNYNPWGKGGFELGFARPNYTDKIYRYKGNRLIKVLIGQRRVGKSYILRQIAFKLIESGVDKKNIFFVNREFLDFNFLKTYKDLDDLFKLYKEEIKPKGRIYLFIDEIQNIEGWENAINSYSQDYMSEYEVFISGSNSSMLAGELASLLSGRYVKFEVFPLSFNEYIEVTKKKPSRDAFLEYMQGGAMPELFILPDYETKRNYISALKDTVLLRDIIQRYNIKDARLLEDIFIYIVNNASNLMSIRNISNYFKSNGRRTSYDTIASYIGYIAEAYLIHKAERYNIRGKDVISGVCKYYVNDLSFNNYLYKGYGYGIGYLLENLVYLELLRNGYIVYIGSIKDKEVDFVAIKGDRTIYIQCAFTLNDNQTMEREYSSLEAIDDNYEKYVVSTDDIHINSKGGIRHIPAWRLSEILL
ncbi:MAG: ATP-binding protein [Bacteroidales bacterium]|jgi:predicted AAA+ superfamily ATPase|nr:ATP-binding protein [Bacteroidales bacterium]